MQPSPQPYLLAADVFVLYSHAEPFPLSVLEAREAGCAIVASDVDGLPEALDGGAAGLLVAPRNPQALQREIVRLLQDEEELNRLKLGAQRDIGKYHVQRLNGEVEAVYRELLGAGAAGAVA